MKIYAASKTIRAAYWRRLRAAGIPISSTWIDEAEAGQTKDLVELAERLVSEVKACDVLLLYIDAMEQPKGAFIEVGVALAANKSVLIVAPNYRIGLFGHHPLVLHFRCVAEALEYLGLKKPIELP